MSQTIDLANLAEPDDDNDGLAVVQTSELLALVRAVRAARTLVYSSMDDLQTCAYFDALDEALALFTDSAEPAA